ncbi:MAG: hypothetical protein IPL83_14565 [Bdellovibrionales bacterium]|nr:hypothetical protein [Bdellovibrionales bacterium]
MKNRTLRSRRQFLSQAGLIGLGVLISACGGGHSQSPPREQPKSAEVKETCAEAPMTAYTNPGHFHTEISLSLEELMNATPGVYVLLGGSHNHSFNLESEDFVAIERGDLVEKEDLEDHGHRIRIVCSA